MFTNKGVIIPLGGGGEVDSSHTYTPSPLAINNKTYMYHAVHNGIAARIALAVSKDGTNFVKKGVVVPLGAAGQVNDNHQEGTGILKFNDKTYCYGAGHDNAAWRVTLAISENGM